MWYERALELQTKAFGKRHDRTLRIQEDLADVLERERVEKGDSVPVSIAQGIVGSTGWHSGV